ncbi:hypothetical protein SCHPADRAFT_544404 [Schizopora paradoxa]|uniref:CRIB domain-containing protein n=1 Tax=Schizopora paradoxa TaxID=27342 RepID=A0A0H2RDB0_9AGAM|nr:hypothetical protein SCHPADRAFT_544404 [Schizopora paradoxa]
MLSLLCHHPQLPADIPSSSSSTSLRASKRAAAVSALSVSVSAVAGPTDPSSSSGGGLGLLSRHNTLKKRRHFSLTGSSALSGGAGGILRSSSRASARCVSSSNGPTNRKNSISAPTDFRHHFHLGVEIVRVLFSLLPLSFFLSSSFVLPFPV